MSWQWADVSEAAFTRLIRNYTNWHLAHPRADMHTGLSLLHRAAGEIPLDVQMSEEQPDAERLMTDYIAAIGEGLDATPAAQVFTWPWLRATTYTYPGLSGYRIKSKSALLRQPGTTGRSRRCTAA